MTHQSFPDLYSSLTGLVEQQISDRCPSRMKNMVFLLLGMFLSRSVQLNLMARKLPLRGQKLSVVQRLRRFLDNGAVQVRPWYEPTARLIVQWASVSGRLHLIIDGTKVSGHHQLLMVAVAYQQRALPLAWTWVRHSRGHSSGDKQIALLTYVRTLIPDGVKVSLVGDGEFGQTLILDYLHLWGWDYALRQAGHHLVCLPHTGTWQRIDALPIAQDQTRSWGRVWLTQARPYPTTLFVSWVGKHPHPWFLATNQTTALETTRLYRRRMWIEELFGDLKGHGVDLENSHLQHFLRLSRLTLAVCLLYVWIILFSQYVLQHGLQAWVDRSERRDLSVFRLGWDFLERLLALRDPIPKLYFSNLCSVNGS